MASRLGITTTTLYVYVKGINTYLFKPPSSYLGQVKVTDSAGTVIFNLPDQTYRVRADYLGQQFWSNEFTATNALVDIASADAEITVTGNGAALNGVNVYVFSAAGAYLGLSQTTDASGKVVFRLPAGDYRFRADYQGSQYWSLTEILQADVVNPVPVSTGGGTFVLTVQKDSSQPLAGVNCYVFSAAGSYLNMTAVTDAAGQVSFNLADGNYKIRIDHLGYQYWTGVFTVPTTLSDTYDMAHHDTTITVNSTYQGSLNPLENISVYLFAPGGSYLGISTTTDAGGQATINLPANTYKVRADYMARQFWSAEFAEQDVQINIPEGVANVHVTGSGQDLENVPVYVFTATGSYLGITASTDAAGSVAFNLPVGDYKLRADYQGSQYWAAVTVNADSVNPVELNTGGGLFVLSVDDGSVPLTNAKVYVFNPAGAYLGINGTTDTAGNVAFGLSDGAYRFRVDLLGYQFWSADYTMPDALAATFSVPHQDLTITVQRDYPTVQAIEGVPTYLFTAAGAYMGLSAGTSASGQVVYRVPDKEYKVRADYRGTQFWSDVFQFQNTTLNIPHGVAQLQVTKAASDLAGAHVYLFSATDAYLGWSEVTDANGQASFLLPAASYKFRVDESGRQHWSPVVNVVAGRTNPIPVAIDPLTVTLSAAPEMIAAGQSATLAWTSVGAESCVISPDIGIVPVNGSIKVTPEATTTYKITAFREPAFISANATITIDPESPVVSSDLLITRVHAGPLYNLQAGQNITVTAVIQNNGTDPVVDAFAVTLFIDLSSPEPETPAFNFFGIRSAYADPISTLLVTVNEPVLPGSNVQTTWTFAYPGGNQPIEIVADSLNTVAETNETNNRFMSTLFAVSDNIAPELISVSPAADSLNQQIQQVSVTLADTHSTVDDSAVLASFALIDGNQQTIVGTKSESNDTFIFVPDTLPLADGIYQILLTAADIYGNTRSETSTFIIDNQPPAKPAVTGGTITSGTIQPRPGRNNSADYAIIIEGTREANTEVWINDNKYADMGISPWSAAVTLNPGNNTFEIWLVDLGGHRGPSQWVDITYELPKPVVTGGTITSGTIQPRPGRNNATDFHVMLEGAREANTEVWINDKKYADMGISFWSASLILLPGNNTFEIWLVDSGGHRGPSEWVDITYDQSGSKFIYHYDTSGCLRRVVSE